MAEPFKNLINADTVRAARKHLSRAWPAFDGKRFEKLATNGLEALELKARAQHLRAALEATLPPTFSDAADVIEASLAPMQGSADGEETPRAGADGLAGWAVWPLADYVANRGLADPQRALAALRALTQRFTAEWSIRPFIEQHPELAFNTLMQWTTDPSPHVRRLASEGSRPRLPWGAQLKGLIADPSPTLPLLATLQDDPSAYVRRSVANHLNDIAKDHPALLAQWLEQHLVDASAERRALLKHASRTLIKKGNPRVLKAWGLGQRFKGRVTLMLSARSVAIGDTLTVTATLQSTSARAQKLVIDYAVHHMKANGQTTPKVFKGWAVELAPHETRVLNKRHSLRLITTRQYHAGKHSLDIRVNGDTLAERDFVLRTT
jgi:3-methyladenine DNA glycosylase AlkC